MSPSARARRAVLGVASLGLCVLAVPAVAQVTVEQIQLGAPRITPGTSPQAMQESDYILGGQAGNSLFNTGPSLPQAPSTNQAHALQFGNGNSATIDTTGSANIALQSVFGNRNTVDQQQSGNQNLSNVTVLGDGNTVGTRQQDVTGASATVVVQGYNNTVTAEQLRNPAAISITQVGNGGNVSVTRK